ncbi:hypothetical protein XELAEV_18011991mg [Xenopus laevis]|uniref:Uncharacterized protein n=1 Tax=Xenopus laevis TaxID=8355 RepID=A0A974HXZ5_XENLA|nr:hypothetical protein XELAEV_18011991mg [Xenopus laevis]
MEEDISFSKVTAENKSEGENCSHVITLQNAMSKYNKESYLKSHGVLKEAKVKVHPLSKRYFSDPENKNFTSDLLGGWIATTISPNKEQGDKKIINCAGSTEDTSLASSCTPGGAVVETSFFDLCSSSCINPVDLDGNIREEKIRRLRESKRQQEEHLEKIRRKLKK